MPDNTLLPRAIVFAIERHGDQRYGDRPYAVHLQDVAAILANIDIRDDETLAAAWLHDVLEDTNTKVTELQHLFGLGVATKVWSCTGYGDTRAQRMDGIYWKLARNPDAVPIKVADRISNIRACIHGKNIEKAKMYLAEDLSFRSAVQQGCPFGLLYMLTTATTKLGKIV